MTSTVDSSTIQVLSSLVEANQAPTVAELAAIECVKEVDDVFCNPRQEMLGEEAEICPMKRELKVLHQKVPSLLDFDRPASFPSVPEDVVREIFIACVTGDKNPEVNPTAAPLVFLQICRDFRRIVSSTPALWNAIHINFPSMPPYKTSFEEVIRLWLARSEPLLLDISVQNIHGMMNNRFLSILTDVSMRWNNVSFDLPGDMIGASTIIKLMEFDLTDVRSLCVRFSSGMTTTVFRGAPTHAHVTMTSDYYRSKSMNPRWHPQLTYLTIGSGSVDRGPYAFNFIKLLLLRPHLVECNIGFDIESLDPADTPITEIVPAQSLKVLTFRQGLHNILPYLEAPFLETLEYEGIMDNSILIPFLGRSPEIRRLRMQVTSVSKLQEILPHCPFLSSLCIHSPFAEPETVPCDAFLDDISRRRVDGGLFSDLVNFEMANDTIIVEHIYTLERFLNSMGCHPWVKVALKVEVVGVSHEEVRKHMRKYRKMGVLHLSPTK